MAAEHHQDFNIIENWYELQVKYKARARVINSALTISFSEVNTDTKYPALKISCRYKPQCCFNIETSGLDLQV